MMKLSIITATYNSEKTLGYSLRSVAQQSAIDKIEHIIIDGRSSDQTLQVAKDFPHVAKIISLPDRGIYHAFNRGVEYATGDIIYFLNSDDSFHDEKVVEDVLNSFVDSSQYFCGAIKCIDHNDGTSYLSLSQHHADKQYKPRHQAFFCLKTVFDEIGPFNECLTIAADTYFMKKTMTSFPGIISERIIADFSVCGFSAAIDKRGNVAQQDAIVDILLGVDEEQSDLINKLTVSNRNIECLKKLLMCTVKNKIEVGYLENKKIGIFGIRDLSKIVFDILNENGITPEAYVLSSNTGIDSLGNVDVISVVDLPMRQLDILVNCVEGEHEQQITSTVKQLCPNIEVISWRDI